MTTNHRPTLENKKGKVNGISNSIKHSRSLPQQTKLKYRQDRKGTKLDYNIGKKAVNQLKLELKQENAIARGINDTISKSQMNDVPELLKNSESDEETDAQTNIIDATTKNEPTNKETNDISRNHSEQDSESSSEENESEVSSEDDSEDDTAALLQELEKIKQERKQEKDVERAQAALTSNPLLNVNESDGPKVNKGWRSGSAFSNRKSSVKKDDENYTNDTLKSNFHQKFLNKYIR